MPARNQPDDYEAAASDGLTLWQRLLLALPHIKHGEEKAPLGQRLKKAMLKPEEPGSAQPARGPEKSKSVEELEATVRYADDKERLIGLLAAPLAALIGLLVIDALISHDPTSGRLHVSLSLYHELELVLLGLSLLMLMMAWFRKRLFLGIVTALYGLAIFNLHYWGFGIPYIILAAWLLVRSYRFQRDLREATGGRPRRGGLGAPAQADGRTKPLQSRRYTPPVQTPRRSAASKPEKQKRAG